MKSGEINVLIPTIFYPYVGGITIHVDNLLKNLSKYENYKFHILTYGNQNEDEYYDNVIIHHVPYISKIRGLSYLYNGYKIGKNILKNYKINLIHSHYAFPQGYLGYLLGKKYNIPTILTLHGSDVLKLPNNLIGKFFLNKTLYNTDHLITVSEYLKRQLPSKCQYKTTVIYNGIDFNLFQSINVDEEYALFVGSFIPQKGIDFLIDTIKDINFNFKLIGTGPLFDKIKKRIKMENITNVELLGSMTQREVSEYIKRCSFLLLPSKSEGLGMVLLESNACGKPVIATNVGGIPEIVKDGYNGYVIDYGNVNKFKNRIIQLIENKKLRKKMGHNGLKLSKNFTWDKCANTVYKIYKDILNSK